ncbi:class I lanthipeptide [uncultured Kordia sp.]|uniref:class I lanthipeptide n=1 Tax=uncultured Kordia sp. TaxID=507699 RepID=UPI002621189C|nr:class I lanthipeptide [uncultured Kordia sp.]
MKKRNLKSLQLNKKSISKLNHDAINGGALGFTSGCTDGCGSVGGATMWNCTNADCTADCDTFVCDTRELCTYCPGVVGPHPNPKGPARG